MEGGVVSDVGPRILGVSWSLLGVSALFLSTRLYFKFTTRGLWWDDWSLIGAWVMLLSNMVVITYAVHLGFGKHIGEVIVDTVNFSRLMLLASISSIFSLLGASWSKTSFALTLLRLTAFSHVRYGIWAIIITLNLALTFNSLLPFISCSPVESGWNPLIPGMCWDRGGLLTYSIFAAAYSAGMDFLLALIPTCLLYNVQMATKEKLGVVLCMSLGFVAGATSIVRCFKIPLITNADSTFEAGQLAIWTVAEIATTIMASSIPVLRNVVKKAIKAEFTGSNYMRSTPDGTFKHNRSHTTVITARANMQKGKGARSATSQDAREFDFELGTKSATNGAIVKVETVTVDYGLRTPGARRSIGLGLDLERVPEEHMVR